MGQLTTTTFTTDDRHGIHITDTHLPQTLTTYTPTPVDPTPAPDPGFPFPVEHTRSITTAQLQFNSSPPFTVRQPNGDSVSTINSLTTTTFPDDTYVLDFDTGVKVYIYVTTGFTVDYTPSHLTLTFHHDTPRDTTTAAAAPTLIFGLRSYHTTPEYTITTPSDPTTLATAIEHLSDSLLDVSPQHAYPSVRNHPPALKHGDTLTIPDACPGSGPDTDVTLTLPPKQSALYAAAPLCYYLSADLTVSDDPPTLETPTTSYSLTTPRSTTYHHWSKPHAGSLPHPTLTTTLQQLLRQVFFCDCLTRTHGYIDEPLDEHQQVTHRLTNPPDWKALYDEPLATRLDTYLELPYDTLAPSYPDWRVNAVVPPTSHTIPVLPYALNHLGLVTPATATTVPDSHLWKQLVASQQAHTQTRTPPQSDPPPHLPRTPPDDAIPPQSPPNFVQPTSETLGNSGVFTRATPFVKTPTSDARYDVWFGPGISLTAATSSVTAYEQKTDQTGAADTATYAVVCQAENMTQEFTSVNASYAETSLPDACVESYEDLTTDELRTLLTSSDITFIHYIGHITREGFVCSDGTVDAASLSTIGPDVFVLNGCTSYTQGQHLIENGAIGGVVTLADIPNQSAVSVGTTIATLLGRGFPLAAAFTHARDTAVLGCQYTVLGAPGVTIAAVPHGIPSIYHILSQVEAPEYTFTMTTYFRDSLDLGAIVSPQLTDDDATHLTGSDRTFTVEREAFWEFVSERNIPVKKDGSFLQDTL